MMTKYKYIMYNGKIAREHKKVMEEYIGRKLTPNECIHHIDGNGTNNHIKNLQLTTQSEHSKILHKKILLKKKLKCNNCKIKFYRSMKKYNWQKRRGQKYNFCSRRCCIQFTTLLLPNSKYKGTSKFNKIIEKGLNEGLTGYKIAKKYKLNRTTVYYYINRRKSPIV